MKGSENLLADFLSRHAIPESKGDAGERIIRIYKVNVVHSFLKKINSIVELQDTDIELEILKMELRINLNYRNLLDYCVHKDVLFRKIDGEWKLKCPSVLIPELLNFFHDERGHFGVHKTFNLIREKFYFQGVRKIVKGYVKSCAKCQQNKIKCTSSSAGFRPVLVSRPGELLSVDIFGPLPPSRGGSRYVLVMVDAFSKFIMFCPMRKATTGAVLRAYGKWFDLYGKPDRILSDLGTQFSAKAYEKKLAEWGIVTSYTSVRHPQENMVERCMRELGRLCRTYCEKTHQAWAWYLPDFADWLNSGVHQSTGFSPKLLHCLEKSEFFPRAVEFPKTKELPKDKLLERAAKNFNKNVEIRKKAHPTKRILTSEFKCGDWVWLKSNFQSSVLNHESKKLFPLYVGPYRVLNVLHFDTYLLGEIDRGKERGIFHISLLKRFVGRSYDC